MKDYQKEYEKYAKEIVDKFSDMCSVKNDYLDYCNYTQPWDGTCYTYRSANIQTLIDAMFSGVFKNENVLKIIRKRQEIAKKWLSENLLNYDDWIQSVKL